MLAKENRLSKNGDFQVVFKKGKMLKGRCLSIGFLKNRLEANRFGFVISNKISKSSVVRHKIKRRLSGAIFSVLPEIKKGFDFVVLALPVIKDKTYKEIKEDIVEILNLNDRKNT